MDYGKLQILLKSISETRFTKLSSNEFIKDYFCEKNHESLTLEFAEKLTNFQNKRQYPNYVLSYFLALATQYDYRDDDFVELVHKSGLGQYLITGLKLGFLKKSKSLSIGGRITHESFDNKYSFVKRHINTLSPFEYKPLNNVLRAAFKLDESSFKEILVNDKTSFVSFFTFSDFGFVEPSDEFLIDVLNCSDYFKSIVCFHYIMREYTKLASRKDSDNDEQIELAVEKIKTLISFVREKRVLDHIYCYMLAENSFPTIFLEILEKSECIEMYQKYLNHQYIKTPEVLNRVVQISNYLKLGNEKLKKETLFRFIKEHLTITVFKEKIDDYGNIVEFLPEDLIDGLMSFCELQKRSKLTSEFDRQVRLVKYNREITEFEFYVGIKLLCEKRNAKTTV